jgi:hypothetical protein
LWQAKDKFSNSKLISVVVADPFDGSKDGCSFFISANARILFCMVSRADFLGLPLSQTA